MNRVKEQITTEQSGLPEQACEEVLDFIRFLKTRRRKDTLETAIASESALGKDWLAPEEDEAWSEL